MKLLEVGIVQSLGSGTIIFLAIIVVVTILTNLLMKNGSGGKILFFGLLVFTAYYIYSHFL